MVVYVGGESDEWIEKALSATPKAGRVQVNLMEALGDRVKEDEVVEGMEHEHHHEHGEEAEEHEHHEHEPDVAIRSMGPAAARPVIKGLLGSHVELTEDGAFCGDMSATSPDHAVASEVLTAHRLRVLRGPHILAHSFSAAGGVVQVERRDIPFDDSLFHGYVAGYSESSQPGYATAVGVSTQVAGATLKGELSGRRMGDMETPDGALKNTDIQNRSGAVGAAYALGRFRFGASYRWFDSDYGIPGGFIGVHPNGVDIDLWKRDLTLRGMYLPMNNSTDTLDVTIRINQYHHKELEGGAVGAEFAVNQENLRLEHQR